MTYAWDQLTGANLAGRYVLEHRLADEPGAAYFETAIGEDARRAMVKLVPELHSTAEIQLARWRKTAALAHPNLLALLDCGRAELPAGPFLYAVFEYPDDRLENAVASGPMTEAETREVRDAVLAALRYLHQQGMVHTSVDAGHIFAVGDQIKLATGTVREAALGAAPAEDVQALGALLHRLRTGTTLEPGDAPDLSEIPYTAPPVAVPPPPVARVREPEPLPPPPAAKRSIPVPVFVAGTAVVVIGAVMLWSQRSAPPPQPVAAAPAAAPAAAAPEPPRTPEPQPAAPVESPPEARAPEPAPPPVPASTSSRDREVRPREVWRVIAYTYNHYSQAERKAQSINRQKPGFEASVFAPKGADSPPFLVSLGGRMTRDEADALRRKARARGLPRDTYIQNYSN